MCVSLYSLSKQVDILWKFEGWFWLIHISSNCVSKTSKFCCWSASWEHWQFWFVNPSDANSPAGNCSNSEVCKEILERALMLAVWTVWFCNPASSISASWWVFMALAEGMARERCRETTKSTRQGQWGEESWVRQLQFNCAGLAPVEGEGDENSWNLKLCFALEQGEKNLLTTIGFKYTEKETTRGRCRVKVRSLSWASGKLKTRIKKGGGGETAQN